MLFRTYFVSLPQISRYSVSLNVCVTSEMHEPDCIPYELAVEFLDEDGKSLGVLKDMNLSVEWVCEGWETRITGTLPESVLPNQGFVLWVAAYPSPEPYFDDEWERPKSPPRQTLSEQQSKQQSRDTVANMCLLDAQFGDLDIPRSRMRCLPCVTATLRIDEEGTFHQTTNDSEHCFRMFRLQGKFVRIREEMSASDFPTGGHLWDAGIVLADLLASGSRRFQGKSFLELGSGCGLPAITAALALQGRVVATDRKEVVPLTEKNLALNCSELNVTVVALDWKIPEHRPLVLTSTVGQGGFDVILLADGLYSRGVFEPLRDTILELSRVGTYVLVAHKPREEPWMLGRSADQPKNVNPLCEILAPWFDSRLLQCTMESNSGVMLIEMSRVR